jgi:hypothetical protein
MPSNIVFSGLIAFAPESTQMVVGLLTHASPAHHALVMFEKKNMKSGPGGLKEPAPWQLQATNPDDPNLKESDLWCVVNPSSLAIQTSGQFDANVSLALFPARDLASYDPAALSKHCQVLKCAFGKWRSGTRPVGQCKHAEAFWLLEDKNHKRPIPNIGYANLHDKVDCTNLGDITLTVGADTIVLKPNSTVWIGNHFQPTGAEDKNRAAHVSHFFHLCKSNPGWELRREPDAGGSCLGADPVFCPPGVMA